MICKLKIFSQKMSSLEQYHNHEYYKRSQSHSGFSFYRSCELGWMQFLKDKPNLKYSHDRNFGLYRACKGGQYEIIDFLIKLGADDFNIGLKGACRGGYTDIAKIMIKNGADNLNLALEAACRGPSRGNANADTIVFLVKYAVNNDYELDLNSGLKGALRGGNFEAADYMIKSGANDFKSLFGEACRGERGERLPGMSRLKTGLEVEKKYIDIIKLMIKRLMNERAREAYLKGVEVSELPCFRKILSYGYTVACNNGNGEICNLLIKEGAEIRDANNLLCKACENGFYTGVELIIKNEPPSLDLNQALKVSCRYGRTSIIRLLIDNGAND